LISFWDLPVPPNSGILSAVFPRAIANSLKSLYKQAVSTNDLITVDPDILGGTPVFKGTRVPVKTLFEYLEDNYSLDEFLECFPSVTREMARRILERSESALLEPVAA
jgi:uncharacterized protein (DUF433 family)